LGILGTTVRLKERLTLHGKDEFAASRDADRRTFTARHVVILLSWGFWTYLTHTGFIARGSGATVFEVPEGAVLAVISVLSLSLGPLSASVIVVTLESDFSGSFLPLLGSFALADDCWLVLSGAASHRRPAYPPPKAMVIARRYANKAGI